MPCDPLLKSGLLFLDGCVCLLGYDFLGLGLEVTRVTRDAKSTLESTVTKYLLTVDFLGQAWTCSGIAC